MVLLKHSILAILPNLTEIFENSVYFASFKLHISNHAHEKGIIALQRPLRDKFGGGLGFCST